MKLKLKRIAPLSAGKLLAAFYGILSLLFVPMMLGFMALSSFVARSQGVSTPPPPLPLMLGMGVGFVIFLPLIYAAMGFVFGVIAAFVYNLLARWIGGLEVEFESASPTASGLPPL